jgi:hypothetical protein
MITQQEFDLFVKHYSWMVLINPAYRVGQAFINYFPTYKRRYILENGKALDDTGTALYYNTNNEECWNLIRKYIE